MLNFLSSFYQLKIRIHIVYIMFQNKIYTGKDMIIRKCKRHSVKMNSQLSSGWSDSTDSLKSCHLSQPVIILGRFSRQHPVSTQSWLMYVFTGWPTLIHPSVRVPRRTLLMSLSLLFQQCPVYLAHFM